MIMKKRTVIAGVALCGIGISACNTDLLNTSPDNKYVESNFWGSEAAANAALTGCYNILHWDGVFSNDAGPLWEETMTPNALNYTNTQGFNSVAQGTQDASTGGIIGTRWARPYGGIGRCNTFLARVDEVEMDPDKKEQMKSEAKFLRALFYFILESYYGDVPLILDPPELSQGNQPRTSRDEVVSQLLKDLEEAAAVLPESYGNSDLGRATRGAAMALKAKVLLHEASPLFNNGQTDPAKWQAAADAAKTVIDLGIYDLFPQYEEFWLPENENNEEVIFDVQYIYPDGGNSFDLIGQQYNTNAPLQGLVDAYLMEDGLPASESPLYDPANPYEHRDPRFYATVVYPGAIFRGELVTEDRFAITGYGMRKYTIYNEEIPPEDKKDLKGGQSETNYIVLRYADILLMYAEAMNEANGPSGEVYDALNKIRARADMPAIGTGYSQVELREIIRHERRIELAGEGYYYNDIRRWMTAEEALSGPIYGYGGKEIQVRTFNPARDYWWPIPQGELDLNPELKQNDGF